MSAKRQATSDLNHDNWDKEEEPEERGTFRVASEDELKGRVIKKARRKIGNGSDVADTTKSPFSGFAGFGKTTTTAGTGAVFSFLSKTSAPTEQVGSTTQSSSANSKPLFSFGTTTTTQSTPKIILDNTDSKPPEEKKHDSKIDEKSPNYYAKLKGLNLAVSDWIKSHVDNNPLCILTPIFKDYENFLNNLEKEEKSSSTIPTTSSSVGVLGVTASNPSVTSSSKTTPTFSFGSTSSFSSSSTTSIGQTNSTSIFGGLSKSTSSPQSSNGFSFGLKTTEKSPPTFSFSKIGSVGSDGSKPSGFTFTPGATPFSFGNTQPTSTNTGNTTETAKEDEDEEDQPPKVEFKQVVEDDAIYSKKCKVFVKKDGNYADRGVGTMYLKPVKDSEKTQLLVRADTNLGNILLNIILTSGIPTQRMGKNNVMLVCYPTPDAEKAAATLLRVKTSDEADELLQTIEKYKK